MSRLTWGDPAFRTLEHGVDRGVLYVDDVGVPWHGLVNVSVPKEGAALVPHYYEGVKYTVEETPSVSKATLSAFTYPDEFYPCIGLGLILNSFYMDNQPKKRFHMSFRTQTIDANGNKAYRIHFLYNAMVLTETRTYATINADAPEASTFDYELDLIPLHVSGFLPSAYFVFDASTALSEHTRALEDVIYGSTLTTATLPDPESIRELIDIELIPISVPDPAFVIAGETEVIVPEEPEDNGTSITDPNDPQPVDPVVEEPVETGTEPIDTVGVVPTDGTVIDEGPIEDVPVEEPTKDDLLIVVDEEDLPPTPVPIEDLEWYKLPEGQVPNDNPEYPSDQPAPDLPPEDPTEEVEIETPIGAPVDPANPTP